MPQTPTFDSPSTIHEHGDLRVREHFDRLAAEDNRGDTSTPVRGHHDQIAPSRGGGINNRLIDLFVLDVKHLADDTGGFGRSRDGTEHFLGMSLRMLLVFGGGVFQFARREREDMERLSDRNSRKPGIAGHRPASAESDQAEVLLEEDDCQYSQEILER
jgi:hypothetical protein